MSIRLFRPENRLTFENLLTPVRKLNRMSALRRGRGGTRATRGGIGPWQRYRRQNLTKLVILDPAQSDREMIGRARRSVA